MTTAEVRQSLRFKRLKHVFEGRQKQLAEVRSRPWPRSRQDDHDYGNAVVKYTRARTAWRAIREWQ